MNQFQRQTAGLKGNIESGVDDVRHEYERAMWGRKTTGEADIFTTDSPKQPEQEAPEIGLEPQGQDIDDGMDI